MRFPEKIRLTVIVENTTLRSNLIADHGLSILIEAYYGDKAYNVLFDTGNNPKVFLHNINELNIKINDIDFIVISHGHYDHTGGLVEILKLIKRRVPIILHPDALLKKLSLKPKLRYIGIPFTEKEIEAHGGILIKNKKSLEILPGIYVLGEIPRITDFETVNDFYTIRNNEIVKDEMLDDQGIAIKMRDGLVILGGCSHSGIINISRYALEVTNQDNIKYIAGGFHLINADKDRIKKTIEFFIEKKVSKISPMHCSGIKINCEARKRLPNAILELHTGDQLTIR